MPSLRVHYNRHPQVSRGFTLIEMLVIAPIVLLVIAGIVSGMVSMIGDSLIASHRAGTAYGMHDSFTRIEQDTRVATSFAPTLNPLSPQGKDDATASFLASSNDLILTQQATTASPYAGNRDLVYYTDSSTGYTSKAANKVLVTRAIYYLSSTGKLIRRTTIDPWNKNATPNADTVCDTPWQRNTCREDIVKSKPAGSPCQAVDEILLTDVSNFAVTYYTTTGTTTTDPAEASSISVSITVTKKVSGSDVSQTNVLRVTRSNNIPLT